MFKPNYSQSPEAVKTAIEKLGLQDGSEYVDVRFGGKDIVRAKKIVHVWTIDQLFKNGKDIYHLNKSKIAGTCPQCHGAGAMVVFEYKVGLIPCNKCDGSGKMPEVICRFCTDGVTKNDVKCAHCGGTGKFRAECGCVTKDRKTGEIVFFGSREQKFVSGIKSVNTCYVCKGTGGTMQKPEYKSAEGLLDMI